MDPISNFDFDEDTTETIIVSASDIDLDNLSFFCNPLGDNIECSVNGSQITFTPALHYFGMETVTISVQDGNGGQDSQNIDLTVNPINDPPILENIGNITFNEDDIYMQQVSATDVDSNNLSYGCTPSTNDIICDVEDQEMTITPDSNWNGTVDITVFVVDGDTGQDSQVVQVTVDPENDDPVLDEIPDVSFLEDQTFDQAFTVSDPDRDFLFYDCTSSEHITCSITSSEISFTPDPDWNGSENIGVSIIDGNGGEATQDIGVTVTSVNDPPILSFTISVPVRTTTTPEAFSALEISTFFICALA